MGSSSSRLRLNLLGVLSLLLGIVAVVATRVPVLGFGPLPIALLGLCAGVVGFLLSVLIGRSGSGLAVLGMLACAGAIGFDNYSHDGLLAQWAARLHAKPADASPGAGCVPAAPTGPEANPMQRPAQEAPDAPPSGSIFDTGPRAPSVPGTFNPPAAERRTPAAAPGAEPRPSEPASAARPPENPPVSVEEAKARVEGAAKAYAAALSRDVEYRAALAKVDAADAARKDALHAGGPGSAEVVGASQRWVDAKSKLQKVASSVALRDAGVRDAQRELNAAEAALKAARK